MKKIIQIAVAENKLCALDNEGGIHHFVPHRSEWREFPVPPGCETGPDTEGPSGLVSMEEVARIFGLGPQTHGVDDPESNKKHIKDILEEYSHLWPDQKPAPKDNLEGAVEEISLDASRRTVREPTSATVLQNLANAYAEALNRLSGAAFDAIIDISPFVGYYWETDKPPEWKRNKRFVRGTCGGKDGTLYADFTLPDHP